jgi:predicted ArsR family transcriptional regulator
MSRRIAKWTKSAGTLHADEASRIFREIEQLLPTTYLDLANALGITQDQAMGHLNSLVHHALLRVEGGRFVRGEMAPV